MSYLQDAFEDEEGGRFCGFCKKLNDFADDLGYWYISPTPEESNIPCCKECYDGDKGKQHIKRYGLGDR